MTDRNRLKQLIHDSTQLNAWNVEDALGRIEDLADHLLANGVIVPPCKVGDTAYFLLEDDIPEHRWFISQEKITEVCSKGFFTSACFPPEEDLGDYTLWAQIGKTVFLIKEQADKALEERYGM